MKKPKVSFGSIYTRGKKGTFYFENRKKGINPTSLKTIDPELAIEKAVELFGYLQFKDEEKQHEHVLQQFQNSKKRNFHSTSSILLDDIEVEYKKILNRVGKSKGNLHVGANANSSLSPETLRTNFIHVNVMRKWINKNYPKIRAMHEITPVIADQYMENLRETRKSKTYNNHLNSLRVIWKRLNIKAGITVNPFESVTLISKQVCDSEKDEKRPFSLEQLEIIFETAQGTKWEPVCRIAYETGLRFSDVCTIKRVQVDDQGFLDLREIKTRKSGKEHLFYIPDSLPYINEWLKNSTDSDFLFPSLAKDFVKGELIPRGPNKEFGRFLKKCGIDTTVKSNGRSQSVYGFHSFRVSWASLQRSGGASIEEVQKGLGHSDESVTKGYIHEFEESIKSRLIAEHQPLPLAGGNLVTGLLKQIAKVYNEMTEEDKKVFYDGIKGILGIM